MRVVRREIKKELLIFQKNIQTFLFCIGNLNYTNDVFLKELVEFYNKTIFLRNEIIGILKLISFEIEKIDKVSKTKEKQWNQRKIIANEKFYFMATAKIKTAMTEIKRKNRKIAFSDKMNFPTVLREEMRKKGFWVNLEDINDDLYKTVAIISIFLKKEKIKEDLVLFYLIYLQESLGDHVLKYHLDNYYFEDEGVLVVGNGLIENLNYLIASLSEKE